MAGAQKGDVKTNDNLTSAQSEADNPVTTRDYNANRSKRPRPDASPQNSSEISRQELEVMLSTWKQEQEKCLSNKLTEQTALISILVDQVSEITSQNIIIQETNAEIRKTNNEIERSMLCIYQSYEELKKEVSALRKEHCEQQYYIENLETKIKDLQYTRRSRSSSSESRKYPPTATESTASCEKAVSDVDEHVSNPFDSLSASLETCFLGFVDTYVHRKPPSKIPSDSVVPQFTYDRDIETNDDISSSEIIDLPDYSKSVYDTEHLASTKVHPMTSSTHGDEENNDDGEIIKYVSAIPRMSYEDLKEATNNWSDNNLLGKGGFGLVYKGEWKYLPVAVKRLKRDNDGRNKELIREMCLNQYQHDNILPLYGYSLGGPEACLIHQLMTGGSLEQRLREKAHYLPLTWPQRYIIAHGVARVYGTRPYLPDEYLRGRCLSPAVDVFSYGVVLVEMATALLAIDRHRPVQLLSQYMHDLNRVGTDPATLEDPVIRHTMHSNPVMCREFFSIGLHCTDFEKRKRSTMLDVYKKLDAMQLSSKTYKNDYVVMN